jgi:hypothetical protein
VQVASQRRCPAVAALCLIALFTDGLGWLLAIVDAPPFASAYQVDVGRDCPGAENSAGRSRCIATVGPTTSAVPNAVQRILSPPACSRWRAGLANGRWVLKHAVRGAVTTFTRDELASIEAVESRTSRSGSRYRSAARRSAHPPPLWAHWTNGASGITLKDCVLSVREPALGERSTVEFWRLNRKSLRWSPRANAGDSSKMGLRSA